MLMLKMRIRRPILGIGWSQCASTWVWRVIRRRYWMTRRVIHSWSFIGMARGIIRSWRFIAMARGVIHSWLSTRVRICGQTSICSWILCIWIVIPITWLWVWKIWRVLLISSTLISHIEYLTSREVSETERRQFIEGVCSEDENTSL